MPGFFTLDDMRVELADHEETLAEYRGLRALEQIARTRRWLDDDGGRPLFAQAAAQLESNWRNHGTGSVGSLAKAGGWWHLAGEPEEVRRALSECAAGGTDWEPIPQGAAGVMYLLGEFDRAARHAPDDPEGWIAAGARDRDVALIEKACDHWLAWLKHDKMGPQHDYSPHPLTKWDWIEETFRLEAELRGEPTPTHLEMLRRTGVLRESGEPAEVAPPPRPEPKVGARIALGADGGLPMLGVTRPDWMTFDLAPDLSIDVARDFPEQGWGVRLREDGDDEGEWILSPSEPEFQGAALWAAGWFELMGNASAAADVRRLIDAHDAAA